MENNTNARPALATPATGTPPAQPYHTGLFWPVTGAIACRKHAPFPESDSWVNEKWGRMDWADMRQFKAEVGREAECETCAAIARNANG